MSPANPVGAHLELRRLVKRYDREAVVRDVSITVEAGEFLTLLGPSGSGKTTTLSLIAGFIALDAGGIFMDGHPIQGVRRHQRNIGVVFQHYALFPHMTAAQNIAFPLQRRRVSRSDVDRRVREALELVGLEGMGARRPNQLSGGQQQRVALARALVFQPRLLLMDEPLGALDKQFRDALQAEIKRIHREIGVTVVYVTHDQGEAMNLSDRIAIFNCGEVMQIGTGAELYERPANLFVASFMGESNCFEGQVSHSGRVIRVRGQECSFCARATDDAAIGESGVILVRPEHVKISPLDLPPEPTENCLTGTVEETTYLGAHRMLTVSTDIGVTVRASEQADSLSAATTGSRVRLTWAVTRTTFVRSGGEAAGRPGGKVPAPHEVPRVDVPEETHDVKPSST